MAEDIEIECASGRIGSISFHRSPQSLSATRTASGFEVRLPIEITMRVRLSQKPMAMFSNLRGNVRVKTPDGSLMKVGTLTGDFRHSAGISTTESHDYKRDKYLRWTGTPPIHGIRFGKPWLMPVMRLNWVGQQGGTRQSRRCVMRWKNGSELKRKIKALVGKLQALQTGSRGRRNNVSMRYAGIYSRLLTLDHIVVQTIGREVRHC